MMLVKYRSLECLGYPKYRVGDDGSVWRYWEGRKDLKKVGWVRRKPTISAQGRPYVGLSSKSVVKPFFVHTLVLSAFMGSCPEGMECCHFPDRSYTNNKLSNLRWGTKKDNVEDGKIQGVYLKGKDNPRGNAKVSWKKVSRIRKQWATGKYTQPRLSKLHSLTQSAISLIVNNKTWNH